MELKQRSTEENSIEATAPNEVESSKLRSIIVVLFSSIIQFFYIGLESSLGIFFVTFVEVFQLPNSQVAIIGALQVGLPFILSPLVSLALEKVSCRLVLMIGGLVFAAGYISAFFTRSFIGLVFAMGVLPGIGGAGSVLATTTVVGHYFDKRRSLAISLTLVGGGLGTMVYPHVVQALIDAISWRGACLIIGGLHLHVVPLAMCLIEAPSYRQTQEPPDTFAMTNKLDKGRKEKHETLSNDGESSHADTPLVQPENVPTERRSQEGNLKAGRETESPVREEDSRNQNLQVERSSDNMLLNTGLQPPQLPKRSSLLMGSRVVLYSQLSLSSMHKKDEHDDEEIEDTYNKIKTVFKSARLMFFVIQNIIFFTGVYVIFHFLPAHAVNLGIDKNTTSWLITMVGLFCLIGMPVWGHMADLKIFQRHLTIVYLVGISVCGLAFVLQAYCYSFPLLLVFSAAVGFTLAANYALGPPLVIHYVSLQHMSISFSLLLMAEGMGRLIGPPFTGFIYDVTGSYAVAMQACGGVIFLAVAVMVLQQLLYRCRCITN